MNIQIFAKYSDRPKEETFGGHCCETKEQIDSYIEGILQPCSFVKWRVVVDNKPYWDNDAL